MRVLVFSQHFPPEVTAGSFRLEAFARELERRGHEVRVVTAVPNHPRGVVEPGFRRRLAVRRRSGGCRIDHLWVYASPRKSTGRRLAYYGSYVAAATSAGVLGRRPDVVLASSPPLTVGLAGDVAARLRRAPLVFDVRDLWPESAVRLGELTNRRVVALAERLERRLYRRAQAIVTVNDAFGRHIERVAPPGVRVEVVPNGTTSAWLEVGRSDVDRAALRLPDDRFVWTYAGNLGLAHALDEAIDAAARLGDGFRLVVIGEGPRRGELERRAAAVAPRLVEFRGLMPPERAALHMRASDALLVAERQDKTVSAKLYDCAAIGRPIVAVAGGELERVVDAEDIALSVPLDDPEALAAALLRLRGDRRAGERVAARARGFAELHRRERQAKRMADILESVGSAARPGSRAG